MGIPPRMRAEQPLTCRQPQVARLRPPIRSRAESRHDRAPDRLSRRRRHAEPRNPGATGGRPGRNPRRRVPLSREAHDQTAGHRSPLISGALLPGHGLLPPEPSLLEFGRGQVSQRRVDPLPVVDVIEESTELAVRIGEAPVLGQIHLIRLLHPRLGVGAVHEPPEDAAKRLPKHPVPVILRGRLAVDKLARGQQLGVLLPINALRRTRPLAERVGIHGGCRRARRGGEGLLREVRLRGASRSRAASVSPDHDHSRRIRRIA
jgi:hypothetical protein